MCVCVCGIQDARGPVDEELDSGALSDVSDGFGGDEQHAEGGHRRGRRGRGRNGITLREYAAYRLQHRGTESPHILLGCRLFQEFIVDQWCKVEAHRLSWIRQNQEKLRADVYQGLMDHLRDDAVVINDPSNLGRLVVLPSSFSGGPRFMQKCYQDSMAIVRKFGKPDLFITMTCNPQWPEIQESLLQGQTANDRPDIIARVFNAKLTELLDDLTKKHVSLCFLPVACRLLVQPCSAQRVHAVPHMPRCSLWAHILNASLL